MKHNDAIYVAGHNGLVGSAIVRQLTAGGFNNVVTSDRRACDLTDQAAVNAWFDQHEIDYVFLAAARVGGIHANNTYRAEFIQQNLAIQTNVIHAAYQHEVKRLLFLGSSCIYPRDCPQPMREEHLLTGPLEPTNEPYAIAKIAGLKMVQAYNAQYHTQYLSLMPTNLYGVNDNFDLNTSHVIPALIRKITEAKNSGSDKVLLWGTGRPRREFLLVDDLADACIFCLQQEHRYDVVNVGSGEEVTIKELAELIASVVGFTGKITFDSSMPDGTPRKLLDSSRIREMGWQPKTSLAQGIRATYTWYLDKGSEKVA